MFTAVALLVAATAPLRAQEQVDLAECSHLAIKDDIF
jgi:hypothetical protein